MKNRTLLLVFVSLLAVSAFAEEAKVTPLTSRELKEFPGKEGLMILVEYPPGSQSTGTTRMHSSTFWKVQS